MRKTATFMLLATLSLALMKPDTASAADGPSCGDLAARLAEINDTFLSRHAPAVEMSISWWNPCTFGYEDGVYAKWDDVAWTQNSTWPIQRIVFESSGAVQYSDAATHELIISCGDGRGWVVPFGNFDGQGEPPVEICNTCDTCWWWYPENP